MSFNDINSIRLLKNLFEQCEFDEDINTNSEKVDKNDLRSRTYSPANLKPVSRDSADDITENPFLKKISSKVNPESLNEWQNLQEEADAEALETRNQPEYTIIYKQAVTTQDLYLQLNCKSAATSSCEHMVVEIQLPAETETEIDKMELNVEEQQVNLSTPLYRLKLPLPQAIDPNKSKAEFDSDKKNLRLTLLMKREFDFVNF